MDDKDQPVNCCLDLKNRQILEYKSDHLKVECCIICGRKHYRVMVDPLQLGAQL